MMKIPQYRRTLNEILRYLKRVQKDGLIKKSMMQMAEETGYSNATIHRSIKTLEKEGYIQIIPSKNPKKPNTIIYLGPSEEEMENLLEKANYAVQNLIQASNEVQEILRMIENTVLFIDLSDSSIEFH